MAGIVWDERDLRIEQGLRQWNSGCQVSCTVEDETMNYPPMLGVRPNDLDWRGAMLEELGGTYKSNWYFLIRATRSNLIHASVNTAKLVNIYERAMSRNQRRAETLLVMNLNYETTLAGPLFGTIVSACASLESFLRMSMRAIWEQDVPKRVRGKGTLSSLAKRLAEFDKRPAVSKLEHAYQTVVGRKPSRMVVKQFQNLVRFRNNCFHGDPVLILSTGDDQTTRGESVREVFSPKQYPLLWHGNRPLSLSHALRAVRLHDVVIRDLLVRRSPKLFVHSDLHDEHPEHSLIESMLPKQFSPDELNALAHTWDNTVESQLEKVPLEEHRDMLIDLSRKLTLRSVKK